MNHSRLDSFYVRIGILSAVLYAIPLVILFTNALFSNLWLLYLGNCLFICSIITGVVYVNRLAQGSAGLKTMLIGGLKITILGVIISCCIILVLLAAYHSRLQQPPSMTFKDKTNGLSYILFFNALVVNLPGGAFGSLAGAIAAKGNQTTEKGKELE